MGGHVTHCDDRRNQEPAAQCTLRRQEGPDVVDRDLLPLNTASSLLTIDGLSATGISLRPASPTVEDGLLFAELLEQAQEGTFRMMLGQRAEGIIARAFTHSGHDLSSEHVTFAERDGGIVGMSSGYDSATHESFTNEALESAAGWRRYRMAAFTRLAARMVRFLDNVPEGDFYVRAIAVDPDHRGQGVGTLLLENLEEDARAAYSNRLALDVSAKNLDARRLYERLGMVAVDASPPWFRIPSTKIIRLAKPL